LIEPVSMGLAGAGPWASMTHAPMLAEGPETRLVAVWSRRKEAAEALAERHGAATAASFDELLDRCEAVAFAVPPDVQAELAVRAARAGKHLLLEKPLALALDPARRLVEAVDDAGVMTLLMLTYRFRAETEAFLEAAKQFETVGARATFITGGFLDGPFATPWRLEYGALHDLGPHVLDVLEAAIGTIETIEARGDSRRWITIVCEHVGGAISQTALSGSVRVAEVIRRYELYGPSGVLEWDASIRKDPPWPRIRREFAAAVREGRPHRLDARHGLHLQELLERAMRSR
jgi:predicted dehydrogenase